MVRSESTAKPAELSFLDEPGRIRGRGGRRRDLTRRLETEPARRRRAANLQALFDLIQDFIWVVDGRGRILWFNQVVVERLGYAPEELVGLSLLAVHPDDRHEEAAAIWADLVAGETDAWTIPLQVKNGKLISVETKFTRGRWFDQRALFAVSRDFTWRRQLEAQLIQSAKLASLGVMAEGIAHEIRTPLTVCSSAAQFILEDDLDPEFRRLCLEKMLSGIARASAIIETLLKFARAPEKVEITRLDLGEIIADTMALAAHQARIQNVELRREMPTSPIYLCGVAGLLPQAFLNLFLNALAAMPNGGVLSVGLRATDQEAVITIGDTGPRIAAADLPDIFAPLHPASEVRQGAGLGLSICQTIIQQHLGSIEVQSTLGQGTRFTVRLALRR